MTLRRALLTVTILGVALALEATAWSQCAMCRTALENSPEGQAMAEGFRKGIILLLAAPYAILGAIGIGVIRWWKNGDRARF